MKRKWETPELIVLIRTRPEEAVLGACKASGTVGAGPWRNCMKENWNPCQTTAGT